MQDVLFKNKERTKSNFVNFIVFHQFNLKRPLAVQFFDTIMFTLNQMFSR